MDSTEKEMLVLSCFDGHYESEIPANHFGLYIANPKKRWQRFRNNDNFAKWLFEAHGLTFTDSKTIRYGEFYIFRVEDSMRQWAELKMKELERVHLGVHFRESPNYGSWGDIAQGGCCRY